MHFLFFLAVFQLMSDSLTAIQVEPHQCPSHQSIQMAMNFFKNCVTTFSSRISVGKKPDGNGIHRKNCGRIFFSYRKNPDGHEILQELQKKFYYEKLFGCPWPSRQKFLTFLMIAIKQLIYISRKEILSASDNGILFLKLF